MHGHDQRQQSRVAPAFENLFRDSMGLLLIENQLQSGTTKYALKTPVHTYGIRPQNPKVCVPIVLVVRELAPTTVGGDLRLKTQ